MIDLSTIAREFSGLPYALIAYYKQCCANIGVQLHGEDFPVVLTIPFPPAHIDYDEDEIRIIFEGFFRRQWGRTVAIRFEGATAH
jgi:hypothetical protein